jgi:hypothetical protein
VPVYLNKRQTTKYYICRFSQKYGLGLESELFYLWNGNTVAIEMDYCGFSSGMDWRILSCLKPEQGLLNWPHQIVPHGN